MREATRTPHAQPGRTRPRASWTRGVLGAAVTAVMVLGGAVQPTLAEPAAVVAKWDFSAIAAASDASVAANVFAPSTGVGASLRPVTTDPLTGYTHDTSASERSIRYQGWDNGASTKSWRVDFSAAGYSSLTVSSQQMSSGSGPRDFALQYSLDGGANWTPVPGGTLSLTTSWSGGALNRLALPAAVDGAGTVSLRWVVTSTVSASGSTVGATGSSRIRDVTIEGIADPAAPTPTAVLSRTPLPAATGVAVDAAVSLTFNKPVEIIDASRIVIRDAGGTSVAGVAPTATGSTLTIAHADFTISGGYTVLVPRDSIRGSDGVQPAADISWEFRTVEPVRDDVVSWTFADSGDEGIHWATGGAYAGTSSLVSVGTTGDYSFTSGENSVRTPGWDGGSGTKYWQATMSTRGFRNLTISSQQTSSGSGPRDFELQFSLDNTTWAVVPGSGLTLSNSTFSCPSNACKLMGLPLPAGVDDHEVVYLRWIMTSNLRSGTGSSPEVQGAGSSRIKDVAIYGERIAGAPLGFPTTPVLLAPDAAANTVNLTATVSARYNQAVEIVDATGILIEDEEGTALPVSVTVNGRRVLLAHPAFGYGHRYTVRIPDGALRAVDGGRSAPAVEWSFTTLPKRPTAFSMNFTGDPRTSMGFSWYTPYGVTGTRVQVARAADFDGTTFPPVHTEFVGSSETVYSYVTEQDRDDDAKFPFSNHKVLADGLTPGTRYVYRAGDGTATGWGPVGSFTTDAATPGEFSFIYGSDSQASGQSGFEDAADTFAKAIETIGDPRFLLVTGDLVDNGDLEEQWQWLFSTAADSFARVPYVPVLGGHEVADSGTTMNNNFFNHFNTPRDVGTGAHEGSVYSFEYGDALFMQMNSQYEGGLVGDTVAFVDPEFTAQLEWMRREAAGSEARWKFVSLHKGPYSSGDNACLWEQDRVAFYRAVLVPLFDELHVDVVLEAHDHMYMRSQQMLGDVAVDTITDEHGNVIARSSATDPRGTLYVMPNALGNKFYYGCPDYDTSFAAVNAQPEKKMFVEFRVGHDELAMRSYTAAVSDEVPALNDNGVRLFDSYTITRSDRAPQPVRNARGVVDGSVVHLSWDRPTGEVPTAYRVFERDGRLGRNWSTSVPGDASASFSLDVPVSADPTIRYHFVVRAVGVRDNSEAVEVAARVDSTDVTAPTVPENLTAQADGPYRVLLAWDASRDDVAVAGYKVFRDGVLAGISATPAFADTGRTPGEPHEYRVSAFDAAGNESARSSAITGSSAPGPVGSGPHRPFAQHPQYVAGALRPSVSQGEMDAAVATLYAEWRDAYLTQNPYVPEEYYVYYNGQGEAGDEVPDAVTTSESNGYGMLITAIMAGQDPDAQRYFDGLTRFALSHPSSVDPYLMAWQQRDTGSAIVSTTTLDPDDGEYYGDDSATDGDLDMAYALLLAHEQWGSAGALDYLSLARRTMTGILRSEVNATQNTLLVGDWARNEAGYSGATRTSDFMLQHLKEFAVASGDTRWLSVVSKTYALARQVASDYSPRTGLLPDFIELGPDGYRPARPDFLESAQDGSYNWNASRTPWRIATDYLMTGDRDAQALLAPMNEWIRSATDGDPAAIGQGYGLDGTPLDPDSDLAFQAPFAVAAMADPTAQGWLDALWQLNVSTPVTSYFGDSIRLLSMIVVSGNWWSPTGLSAPVDQTVVVEAPVGLTADAVTATTATISWLGDEDAASFSVYRNGEQVGTVAGPAAGVHLMALAPQRFVFVDTGLSPRTSYTYTVRAVDGDGVTSVASAPLTVVTLAASGGGGAGAGVGGRVASTGADPLPTVVLALVLLALGGAARLTRRPRRGDGAAIG